MELVAPPLAVRGTTSAWVVALDVTAKAVLLLLLVRVAMDPAWGNLEGKAPGTRALTYPLIAFVIPAVHLARGSRGRYPWTADLLVTIPAFSDVLGNRLDLYDQLVWFDDWMHFMNTGLLCAAVVILSGASGASLRRRLELSVASGMTLALAWELWEYYAFVTNSSESATAYGDTVLDLALGWAGAVAAALLVGAFHPVDQGGVRARRQKTRHPVTEDPAAGPAEAAVSVHGRGGTPGKVDVDLVRGDRGAGADGERVRSRRSKRL